MAEPARSNQRVADAITSATLPYAMATAAKRYLRDTCAYEDAREEGRAKAWLEEASLAAGRDMATVLAAHLEAHG